MLVRVLEVRKFNSYDEMLASEGVDRVQQFLPGFVGESTIDRSYPSTDQSPGIPIGCPPTDRLPPVLPISRLLSY